MKIRLAFVLLPFLPEVVFVKNQLQQEFAGMKSNTLFEN